MINKEVLNQHAWDRVTEYANLPIHDQHVPVPYYISVGERMWLQLMQNAGVDPVQMAQIKTDFHNRQVPYAWFRGKGTPQEIAQATVDISQTMGLPLTHASRDTIREFMKLYDLGIDCSGLVYNVLYHAFDKNGQLQELQNSLNWKDPNKCSVFQAGAFIFSGPQTTLISPDQVQPLDLLVFNSPIQGINHVALFLDSGSDLAIVQSTIAIPQTGINASTYHTEGGKPQFEFQPEIGPAWELLYEQGRLEFRRLVCLDE